MTLIELMVAIGLASIVLTAVAAITVFTAKSFAALGNYNELDRQSRNALDTMSRDIRQTRELIQYNPHWLCFQDVDGGPLWYIYVPSSRVLMRIKTTPTFSRTELLHECDELLFGISQRCPSNNFTFYPATNGATGQLDPKMAKLVDVSWRCSRQMFGKAMQTESVQTAKIVMRN